MKSFIRKHILGKRGVELTPVGSYREALEQTKTSEYANEIITQYVIDSSMAYLDIVKNKEPKFGKFQKWEFDMKVLFESFISKGSELKILDLGGGLVPLYWHLVKLSPELKVRWGVWELEELVKASSTFANENISFFTSPDDCKEAMGEVDVVFSRNSLQYCPDPLKFFSMLLSVNPQVFFLKKLGVLKSGSAKVFLQSSNLLDHGPVILDSYKNLRVEYPVTYCPIDQYLAILNQNDYETEYYYEEEGNEYGSMVTLVAKKK